MSRLLELLSVTYIGLVYTILFLSSDLIGSAGREHGGDGHNKVKANFYSLLPVLYIQIPLATPPKSKN